VARLLGDQGENDEAKFAAVEHAAFAAAEAAATPEPLEAFTTRTAAPEGVVLMEVSEKHGFPLFENIS
jgi:hypothetical protein